jgi:2-dehydro-3-deoxyphosphooctonate aldolase (KDO 8-P synthase)
MVAPNHVSAGNVTFGNDLPLSLIAGPCVMESRDHAMKMAEALAEMAKSLDIGVVYKSSFDKANRTSINSHRGMGVGDALEIFAEIKETFGLPVITDVHTPEQCAELASVMDVLQIPAFLCRQTDLLVEAGNTGLALNIKKGQFLAPWDMANVTAKVESTGNRNAMVCERGASFGYNTLISDMRALPVLASGGHPVIFDATHSVQQPGGEGATSGGERKFAPVLARAAVAVGVAGVFMETHDDPDNAPSDGPNMIKINDLSDIIKLLQEYDVIAKSHPVNIE